MVASERGGGGVVVGRQLVSECIALLDGLSSRRRVGEAASFLAKRLRATVGQADTGLLFVELRQGPRRVRVRNGRRAGELGTASFASNPVEGSRDLYVVRFDDGECVRTRIDDIDPEPRL